MASDRVHLFGIRHHGPGSARSLLRALGELEPDCVLIEGPPDADALLPLVSHAELRPPVALLVYESANPRRSAFYPFAEFSPEWQAARYAVGRDVEVRFMDLPQAYQLAEARTGGNAESEDEPPEGEARANSDSESDAGDPSEFALRRDPLGQLADAAGYPDGERWWDALIESRRNDAGDVFSAVADAMTALREGDCLTSDLRERRREAFMRKTIRAAIKDGRDRIAVVCGAWHVPALDPNSWPPLKDDNAELKGLSKVKTEAAWAPWTYQRLAAESGYGAGVASPAWYELLWESADSPVATLWMTKAARLMRDRDLDASPAQVIEAVRLGETLAALRGRTLAGLDELEEAALTVLCGGQPAPMRVVRDSLVIGDRLGAVPDDAPQAPLQKDLASLQKRLRLPPQASRKQRDLDLRKPMDRERSCLLHRINLLGIPWGEVSEGAVRSRGTFHEHWVLQWAPEFAVGLVEASRYGSTVAEAAAAKTIESASETTTLSGLTSLLGDALLADLPRAAQQLIKAIQEQAVASGDVQQLMAAAPHLAQVSRYGDVRETDVRLVSDVLRGIVERVCVALPPACSSLDDEAAGKMLALIGGVDDALAVLDSDDLRDDWRDSLKRVVQRESAHPLLRGRAARIRHDGDAEAPDETARLMGFALSRAADRVGAAAWIEGFLGGSGLVLIHDQGLWSLVDGWVTGLSAEEFGELLPLLRRTFSGFPVGERRQIGERVLHGESTKSAEPLGDFDFERARRVLPLLATILGGEETN